MKKSDDCLYDMITLSYWEILKRRNNSEYKTEIYELLEMEISILPVCKIEEFPSEKSLQTLRMST